MLLKPYMAYLKAGIAIAVIIGIWLLVRSHDAGVRKAAVAEIESKLDKQIIESQQKVLVAEQKQRDAEAKSEEYRVNFQNAIDDLTASISGSLRHSQNDLRAGVLSAAMEAVRNGSAGPEISQAIGRLETTLAEFSAGVDRLEVGCGKDAGQLAGVIEHARLNGAIEGMP